MNKKQQKDALKSLQTFCEEQKLRLSDVREWVYEIILSSDKPIGAYNVLEELGKKIDNPKPPTAYRAIEFLQEHGFVHRIESLNAYVPCHIDHVHLGSQFMICDTCSTVIEAHLCHLPQEIDKKINDQGFKLSHWGMEIHGQCKDCQS